jgi:Holliday junction resolvasome RuvABC endonuclease subunit
MRSRTGKRFVRFRAWLDKIAGQGGPLTAIHFVKVSAHTGNASACLYGGFVAMLITWAEEKGIPYQGVPVGTIKKHATGNGNANKQAVIQAMWDKGHDPSDADEAFALALMRYILGAEVMDTTET